MALVNVAPFVLSRYPETSPYDLDPIPHNVIPTQKEMRYTHRFLAAMREWQKSTMKNPLRRLNGNNPYVPLGRSVAELNIPFYLSHICPPSLPCAPTGPPMVFLGHLDVFGDAYAFKVQRGDQFFILKAVRFRSCRPQNSNTDHKCSTAKAIQMPFTVRAMRTLTSWHITDTKMVPSFPAMAG